MKTNRIIKGEHKIDDFLDLISSRQTTLPSEKKEQEQ
jgi:hypothetical protein